MSERSIKNFIPNLITLTGLCFGLSSIRFAFLEDFKAAVVCILIAAICDVLDGLFSRLLKSQSDLGAELDSLADFLSFGIAPGILVYFGILEELAMWGYLAVTAFIVFACLRLAIFNLNLPPSEDAQKKRILSWDTHAFRSRLDTSSSYQFFFGLQLGYRQSRDSSYLYRLSRIINGKQDTDFFS